MQPAVIGWLVVAGLVLFVLKDHLPAFLAKLKGLIPSVTGGGKIGRDEALKAAITVHDYLVENSLDATQMEALVAKVICGGHK